MTKSLGGLLYPLITLATITEEKIYPVCNIGYDVYQDVMHILKKFGNIERSYIKKLAIKNIHCYILFASEYGTQYDEGIDVPISFEQIGSLIPKSEFIFVSPMTGFDIQLKTFKKIKQRARCPIYLV